MTEGGRPSSRVATWDWLLSVLVSLVNSTEEQQVRLGIPITLSTGGFLVSGSMIGGKEYFEEFSKIVEEGLPEELFGDEGKKVVSDPIRRLASIYGPDEGEMPRGKVWRERFDFVHLKDATFIHPGNPPVPAGEGMLWRCKVAAVDGFTLGALTSEPIEDHELDE